jgi:hypothetical protein
MAGLASPVRLRPQVISTSRRFSYPPRACRPCFMPDPLMGLHPSEPFSHRVAVRRLRRRSPHGVGPCSSPSQRPAPARTREGRNLLAPGWRWPFPPGPKPLRSEPPPPIPPVPKHRRAERSPDPPKPKLRRAGQWLDPPEPKLRRIRRPALCAPIRRPTPIGHQPALPEPEGSIRPDRSLACPKSENSDRFERFHPHPFVAEAPPGMRRRPPLGDRSPFESSPGPKSRRIELLRSALREPKLLSHRTSGRDGPESFLTFRGLIPVAIRHSRVGCLGRRVARSSPGLSALQGVPPLCGRPGSHRAFPSWASRHRTRTACDAALQGVARSEVGSSLSRLPTLMGLVAS